MCNERSPTMKITLARIVLTLCFVAVVIQAAIAQTVVPGSFVYGGQSSKTLLPTWSYYTISRLSSEGHLIEGTVWREPGSGFTATWEVEHIDEQGAVEYHWVFENSSTQPTKQISNVYALDLESSGGSWTQFVHSTGGLYGPSHNESHGFKISTSSLTRTQSISSKNGRSSNKDLPLWVLHDTSSNSGLYMGVGWSGEWQANISPISGSKIRTTVGMPGTNIALPAGERISSPSVLVGAYQGDSRAGANALRQVINKEYMPSLGNGKKRLPPVSWSSWFNFHNDINDTMLLQQIDVASGLGIEYFCIDAGWFTGGYGDGVGNWTVDKAKFPNGLAPIRDYTAEKGMKLGLWFEPGRAMPGTLLATLHPEWIGPYNQVKLEIPEARNWIFTMMCSYIDDLDLGWIRYDYNQDPLNAWNTRDSVNTAGLTQIRYLQGEYELLDRIRERYPDLVIESCASGGRRIDLETISRSGTIWKSDETVDMMATRGQATGGNYFLPGGLLNTNLPGASGASTFELHSLFAGPMGFATNLTTLDEAARKRVAQAIADYKTVRHLLNKDYYPLFPQTFDDISQWSGWEFYDPETSEGFLTILRPEQSSVESLTVQLGGLQSDMMYHLSRLDGSQARDIIGSELLAGLNFSLEPGGIEVLHFQSAQVPEPSCFSMMLSGLIGPFVCFWWQRCGK